MLSAISKSRIGLSHSAGKTAAAAAAAAVVVA